MQNRDSSKLLFRRGYLVVNNQIKFNLSNLLSNWNIKQFLNHTIYTHPDASCQTACTSNLNVAIIGIIIDPINKKVETKEILNQIIDEISKSEKHFFDYLDCLSGRFIIFVEKEDSAFVVQDAAGTRSLFYDSSRSLFSSHPEIVARSGDYKQTKEAIIHNTPDVSWFPGIATPYNEVKMLTPNTLLRLPSMVIERFFPREPLESKDLTDELVKEVGELFATQAKLWNSKYDLSLSLSAGRDSRLGLAATREIVNDVSYFTWILKDDSNEEFETVSKLSQILNIHVDTIKLNQEPDVEFMHFLKANNSGMSDIDRDFNAYNFYMKLSDDKIEIRSNVAEIATANFRSKYFLLPNHVTSDILAKLYTYKSNSNFVQAKMEEFIEKTRFENKRFYNYDPYDLFHWEQKAGNWVALWFLELDIVNEKISLFNNRMLLKMLLAVDTQSRKKSELFLLVIEYLWPECLSVPINPHKKANNEFSMKLRYLIGGTLIRMPTSLYSHILKLKRRFRIT